MTFKEIKHGQMFVGCQVGEVFVKTPGGVRSGWNAVDSDGDTAWFERGEEARPLPPVADIIRGFLDVMAGANFVDLQHTGLKFERYKELSKLQAALTEAAL